MREAVVGTEQKQFRIDKLLRRERGERLFSGIGAGGRRMLLFQVLWEDAPAGRREENSPESLGALLTAIEAPSVPVVEYFEAKDDRLVEFSTPDPSGVFLGDVLGSAGVLSPSQALWFWEALLSALVPLHEKGMAYGLNHHSRLLLTRRAQVVLPEAGLVPLINNRFRVDLASSGSLLQRLFVEPGLVPPELLRSRGFSPASDVFQTASLVYRLLTGISPFGSGLSMEIYNRMLNNQAEPIRTHLSAVSPGLAQVVAECLQADPSQRPRNASQLKGRLVALKDTRTSLAERIVGTSEKLYSSRFPGILSVHTGGDLLGEELTVAARPELTEIEQEALLGQLDGLRTRRGQPTSIRGVGLWLLLGAVILLAVALLPQLLEWEQPPVRSHEGRLPTPAAQTTHKELVWDGGGKGKPHPALKSLLSSVPGNLRRKLADLAVPIDGRLEFIPPVLPPYKVRLHGANGEDFVLEFTARSRLGTVQLPTPLGVEATAKLLVLYDGAGKPQFVVEQDITGKPLRFQDIDSAGAR